MLWFVKPVRVVCSKDSRRFINKKWLLLVEYNQREVFGGLEMNLCIYQNIQKVERWDSIAFQINVGWREWLLFDTY